MPRILQNFLSITGLKTHLSTYEMTNYISVLLYHLYPQYEEKNEKRTDRNINNKKNYRIILRKLYL
jgi:hypothetical protein